jgi:drug/metabolite transporter superfamily protein YnfA
MAEDVVSREGRDAEYFRWLLAHGGDIVCCSMAWGVSVDARAEDVANDPRKAIAAAIAEAASAIKTQDASEASGTK